MSRQNYVLKTSDAEYSLREAADNASRESGLEQEERIWISRKVCLSKLQNAAC